MEQDIIMAAIDTGPNITVAVIAVCVDLRSGVDFAEGDSDARNPLPLKLNIQTGVSK